ncbi:MAG: hypothetical protein ABIN94_05065 [Ferruginibacter sp.]
MDVKKLLILLLVLFSTVITFRLQKLLRATINDQESLLNFMLLILANALVIFVMVFITAFTIIYFKDFFFKK